MCKSITEKTGVAYYSITDISRKGLEEPDLIATDGLHPSETMYAEWVKRILAEVEISRPDTKDKD